MATVPYSIVRFFQARVEALTGVTLDLLGSPRKKLELGKAKLLHERCEKDLNLVMQVIDRALQEKYLLDHPTLAIVHSKVERLLFALRREVKTERDGWLDRGQVKDPVPEYLDRDYQSKRKIVL